MKIDITTRNIDKGQQKSIKKTVKKALKGHFDSLLTKYDLKQTRIHVTLEQHKKQNNVTLRMHIPPKKVLLAKESDEKLTNALNQAAKELVRQVKKHQAKVSGRENWKRKARRQRIKQFKNNVLNLPEEVRKDADKSLEPLLPRIEQYIKRELTYLQANGDLRASYPTLEDIRDEAILKLQVKWDDLAGNDENLYQQLIRAVHEVLAEEIEETSKHKNDISLEAPIPEDAMDQSEDMVEEDSTEYYQPFENLFIEDIIPDTSEALPDELADKNAREVCYQTMVALPNSWRQVMTLVYQEQLPIEETVESILLDSVSKAERLLKYAEAFMIESLKDRGIAVNKELLVKLLKT